MRLLEANSARKFQLAELLSQSLDECGNAGEYFGEYLIVKTCYQ